MSEPTSPRDELVIDLATVLAEHMYVIRGDMLECDCGWSMDASIEAEEGLPTRRPDRFETPVIARHRAHLADVLLAAGWTKAPAITAQDVADRLFDRAQRYHELTGNPQTFISWGDPSLIHPGDSFEEGEGKP